MVDSRPALSTDTTQVIWYPSLTLTKGTTPSNNETTHKKLQRAIQLSEPTNNPQHIDGPCAMIKQLAPSPFHRDETGHSDEFLNRMSCGLSVDCDISFGNYPAGAPKSCIADQRTNATDDSGTLRPHLEVIPSAFDNLDFSVDKYPMVDDQRNSKESASPCSLSSESPDNGQSAEEARTVPDDNHSDTGGDPNNSKVLLEENTSALDGIKPSAIGTVEENQERSEEPASLRSLSADLPNNGPSGEESKVISDDNDSNAGGDPSISGPLLQGENLASGGISSSVDVRTGANNLGSPKVLSCSLPAKSSDDGTPEMEPNVIPDDNESNFCGDPNTLKPPSPSEGKDSATRANDLESAKEPALSCSGSVKSCGDGTSELEPIIIPDDDSDSLSRLDERNVATRSLKMETTMTTTPENRSPISDDCSLEDRTAVKRCRASEIPAEVETLPKRRRYDPEKNTKYTTLDLHQKYREFKENQAALVMFLEEMLEGKGTTKEKEEFKQYVQEVDQAQEMFEDGLEIYEPDRPSRRRCKKRSKA